MGNAVRRGYPTAYRPSSRPYQSPGQAFDAPPLPANDNRVPPANDNAKPPLRRKLPRWARGLGRGLPALGLVYEAYRLYEASQAPYAPLYMPGFSKVLDCPITQMHPNPVCGRKETVLNACLFAQANPCTYALSDPYTAGEKNNGTGFWKSTQGNGNGGNIDRWVSYHQQGIIPPVNTATFNLLYRPPGFYPQNIPAPSPAPSPGPMFDPDPPPGHAPRPGSHPHHRPHDVPVFSPQPAPMPIPHRYVPHRRPDVNAPPSERTERGPVAPRPDPTDVSQPGPDIVVSPGRPPVVRPVQSSPPRRPPGPGEKERKMTAAIGGFPGRIVNMATESTDVVDSFYQALPEDLRLSERRRRHGKDPRVTVKLQLLYRHWDDVDLQVAIENLIRNQLEDAVAGKTGRALGKAQRRVWNDWGFNPHFEVGPAL